MSAVSIMSGLPNTIIMDIIREATTADTLDYWAERAPNVFNARPNEAMIQSFNWNSDPVERAAVKAKRALNREFYCEIPLDDLDEEYEKYEFEYEGERDINGGLYLVVGGFLSALCEWVNDDNYFNVDVDEIVLNHPLRE